MKRLAFILFAALLTAGNLFAQVKPTKGSWSTEVQINPFDQNGETFTLDGLKARYFFSDKDALRLKVGIQSTSSTYKDDVSDEDTKNYSNDKFKYNMGSFNIDLGYERHFDLAKRLDAYVGGSVGFGKNFASTKIESYSKSITNNGDNINESTFTGELKNGAIISESGSNNILDKAQRASWNLNAAIFAGLDFYIYKGLYIGTELGIGVQSRNSLKMEYDGVTISKTTNNRETNVKEETIDEESTDNYHVVNFTTYIEPRLRIGITF